MSMMKTDLCLQKRNWLVDEMCFKYSRRNKAYIRGFLVILPQEFLKNESVRAFEKRIVKLVNAFRAFDKKLDKVMRSHCDDVRVRIKTRRNRKNKNRKIKSRKRSGSKKRR